MSPMATIPRRVGRPATGAETTAQGARVPLDMRPSELVRLDWLRGAIPRATFVKLLLEQEETRRTEPTSTAPPRPEVPILGSVCAGDGLEVEQCAHDFKMRLPEGIASPTDAYGLIVRGDSMTDPSNPRRSIPDGSVALFWPSPVLTPGSIVHVEWQDAAGRSYATLKRLTESATGGWELAPLNPAHDTLKHGESWTVRGVYITRVEREVKQ